MTLPAEIDDTVRDVARAREPDFYLTALLAPRSARPALVALAAVAGEIERIPAEVSEAPLGEIRLQWWREALADIDAGRLTGHPAADNLARAIRGHAISLAPLQDAVDACAQNLYADPFDDQSAFEAYVSGRYRPLFAIGRDLLLQASQVVPPVGADRELAGAADAYGLARLLADLPRHMARGRVPLPLPLLMALGFEPAQINSPRSIAAVSSAGLQLCEEARSASARMWSSESWQMRTARVPFIPIAMVEPYLQAFERYGPVGNAAAREISPLRRVWRLWRAHRVGSA